MKLPSAAIAPLSPAFDDLLFFVAVMRVGAAASGRGVLETMTESELAIVDLVYSRVRADPDLCQAAQAVFTLSGEDALHAFLLGAVYGAESSEARARLTA